MHSIIYTTNSMGLVFEGAKLVEVCLTTEYFGRHLFALDRAIGRQNIWIIVIGEGSQNH